MIYTYKKNVEKKSSFKNKVLILLTLTTFSFFILPSIYSQQVEIPKTAIGDGDKKTTPKVEKKTTPKATKQPVKKAVVDPSPSTSEVLREINSAPQPKPKPVAKQRPQTKKTVKKSSSKSGGVLFILPEAGLEVLVDEQKQGKYADENGEIEISLSKGKHRFIIRRNGQPIGDAFLTISAESKEIDLAPYISEPTGEEENAKQDDAGQTIVKMAKTEQKPVEVKPNIQEPAKIVVDEPKAMTVNSADVAYRKIIEINNRYKNPKQTDKVTVADWEFVYRQSILPNGLPENLDPKIKNAFMSFAQGQIFLSQNRSRDAIIAFSSAVAVTTALKSESALAHFALGNAYWADKQINEAIKSYKRAIQLEPEMALGYKNLADILYQNGNQAASTSYYLRALELGFGSIDTNLNYANGLKAVESCDKAIKVYESIVKQVPNSEAYYGMGECYATAKLTFRAVEAFKKSIEIDNKNISANFSLGKIYFQSKDYQLAVNYLQKAIDLDKDGRYINIADTQKMIKEANKKLKKSGS